MVPNARDLANGARETIRGVAAAALQHQYPCHPWGHVVALNQSSLECVTIIVVVDRQKRQSCHALFSRSIDRFDQYPTGYAMVVDRQKT